TVLDDYSVSNAQVKADGHKVYGAIRVAVEHLLKIRALSLSLPAEGGDPATLRECDFRWAQPLSEVTLGIDSHLQGPGRAGTPWNDWTQSPCPPCTVSSTPSSENNLAVRFSTDPNLGGCLPLSPLIRGKRPMAPPPIKTPRTRCPSSLLTSKSTPGRTGALAPSPLHPS
uniref:Uncharacterized protein n=1 Tax=Hucho hucho TaxID=62062 RepID=A0A4W5JR83_9TELE